MSYPAVDPNELSVIAVADFFAGRSWAGVMVSVDYYYGFLQGMIYMPVVILFDDPFVLRTFAFPRHGFLLPAHLVFRSIKTYFF